MTKLSFSLAALLVLAAPAAQAQIHVQIELGLPLAPPLVVVAPGIQVVEGFRDEVFFHDGWYWCRRDDGWYRARSPRARFVWIEPRRVPPGLVRLPPGHYRNWHRERELERREFKRERREEKWERKQQLGEP